MEKLTVAQAELVGKAFEEHGGLVAQVARKFAGKNAEQGDLESYLNEKFMEAVLRFDAEKGGSLGAYINTRLRQHALNYLKSAYNQHRTDVTPFSAMVKEGEDGEEGSEDHLTALKDETINIAEDLVKGDAVGNTLATLFEHATDLQKRIMQVYMQEKVKPSYTQVGKAVGVHHETVKRELKKLAKITTFDVTVLG